MTRDQIRAAVSDEQALMCTLLGEAAGQGVEGLVAVASVIRNRATHPRWWGHGYRGVCLAPDQFSSWWESNPNSQRVYDLAEQLLAKGPLGERTLIAELRWIAAGVVAEQLRDNTRGADSYLTAALFKRDPPKWAQGRTRCAEVGDHIFFRLEI